MYTVANPLHSLLLTYLLTGVDPQQGSVAVEEQESVHAFEIMEYLDKAGYSLPVFAGYLENRATLLRAYAYICLYAEQPHDEYNTARLTFLARSLPPPLIQALEHIVNWLQSGE